VSFAEPEPGRFTLTGSAEPLRDDHPDQLRTRLNLTSAFGRADLAFGALLNVVRTGKPVTRWCTVATSGRT
jgi:hypothetical protein